MFRIAPGRAIHQIDAQCLEAAHQSHGVVGGPAVRNPIGGGNPEEQRQASRPRAAHRFRHLQRETHPVIQAAAVFVGAPIAQGREKLVDQVAVRAMDLDHVESRPQGARRSLAEAIGETVNFRLGERVRRRVSGAERHGAGRRRLPAAFGLGQQTAAIPRPLRTAFSPGVRQLDARRRALAVQESRDASQKLDVLVFPDAQVVRCDAPACCHRRGLRANQPGAAHRAATQMYQVPIAGESVAGGVLAHGRNRDPVAQSDLADGERCHQMCRWKGTHSLSMAAEGRAGAIDFAPYGLRYQTGISRAK